MQDLTPLFSRELKTITVPPQNLLADNPATIQTTPIADDALIANAQTLLDQVKTDLNFTQGEVTMFIPDMPNIPPQDVPVMIAQANQAQANDVTTIRTIGVCKPAPNDPANYSGENGISPIHSAGFYLKQYEQRSVIGPATVTILQHPKHGILRMVTEADRGTLFDSGAGPLRPELGLYAYLPEKGYLGKDKAVALVEIEGIKVKVVYFFQAVGGGLGSYAIQEYCGETGYRWKISSTLDASGNNTVTSVEYQSPTIAINPATADITALASTLGSSIQSTLSVDPSFITFNLADLPNGAVGQTTGPTITLDTTASGYGWYIDPTPADNSEFLPTSNPNEWIAKAGSDAAGKMDMLSVLLHEYGHTLGINHSPDPNDYMGTTLTAGVRRLPSAEEMALMQGLVARVKADASGSVGRVSTRQVGINPDLPNNNPAPFPTIPLGGMSLAFVGLLRSSRYGGLSIAPDGSTLVTQYDWAANATLTNGSLNAADGWSTQGSVEIANGAAVMREDSTTQTRLSQVFQLNPTDRFLSFTLSGAALDDMSGAPDDAFELALLDANTGASLLGSTGQTRSDAFLNLQADGTQNLADCVTCINNPDGSRTYRVDLAGLPAGVAANLSFDLIGFGANGSHITVSDVRLSGLPQLHDDTATLLEDSTLAFDPFAQVDNPVLSNVEGAAVLQLGSHIVDQPAHGAVTVNADGTFNYTPQTDYNGADSFTYRLSDGPLESNLATVSDSPHQSAP